MSDANKPALTPLEANKNDVQMPYELRTIELKSSVGRVDVKLLIDNVLPTPRIRSTSNQKPGVRGHANVSRAIQDVTPSQPISQEGNTNTTLTPSTSSNPMLFDYGDSSDLIITILCFIIIAPCFLASIGQLIYTFHRRKRARMEQQLLAVSTNPTSRMLILSEILKNDCRPVTKDQASSRKSRVLVKKYRKKTALEQRLGRSTDEMETNLSDESEHRRDDKEGFVIEVENCSEDVRENRRNSWDVENPETENEGGNMLLSGDTDSTPTTIVYFSEDVMFRLNSNKRMTSIELDNVSTLEEDDIGAESCAHEVDEEAEGMCGNATPILEGKPTAENEISTIGMIVGNFKGARVKEDKVDYSKKSDDEMNLITTNGAQNEKTEENHVASDILSRQSPTTPQSHEIKTDSPNMEIESTIELTPTNYSPTGSAQLPPTDKNQKVASLKEDSSGDVPKIPLLNIFVTTPTKYPTQRVPTPETMMIESDTIQQSSVVRHMPDLSDDDDSCGNCVNNAQEMGSIFRKGQYHDDGDEGAAGGSMCEIQACGSSDTEVASNIEGLKEQLDSFAVGSSQNASSIFHQYSEAVNSDVGNSSEWDIPLQKVDIPLQKVASYKSTTDYSLSSNVSYFSYEDVSIASDELESCAICLCSYEEGDVRIFSKRCSHAFHKECILEWLVKSQNCPCCRIDIVTKSEIDEISASLIGTKRLAEAMAVSEMQEAPPFSVRRSRLARQLMARARAAQRLRHLASAGHNNFMPTSALLLPSSNSPQTPRTTNVANGRDQSLRATSGFLSPPSSSYQAHSINPSRSSDAIMNPHESNQMNPVSGVSGERGGEGGGGESIHISNAGSLFTTSVNQSIFHDNWVRQRPDPPPPMNLSLAPSTPHPHWLRQSQTQNSPSDIFRA